MRKKKTGWPFQEGYLREETQEAHVFTDYRWNTGVVWRDWKVDPQNVDLEHVTIRPFSLGLPKEENQ